MNKITFPLSGGMSGPAVADLQDTLQQCLERRAILSNDENARRQWSERLRPERAAHKYSDVTGKLLSIFQRERNLQSSGEVDAPTADALNRLLQEWGLLDREDMPRVHVVAGQVWRADGLPLRGLHVRAAHEAERDVIRLGEDTTDAEGRYTIRYDLLPGVETINLRVSVIGEDGRPLQSSDLVHDAKPLESIDLTTPMAGRSAPQQRIEGRIILEHGVPADQVKLRVYRHDFGGKTTLLGETTTLAGGEYALGFDPGERGLTIEVRALAPTGEEIPLSQPLNNLKGETVAVNLVAPASLQPLAAEYVRLVTDLRPHIGEMTKLNEAQETKDRQDLTVLYRATGWDARLIALAAKTERLSADPDVQLPQGALYGLLRAGLPSDKLLLAQVEPDVVEQALKTVRDAGIVELNDQQIGQLKEQFSAFATRTRLALPAPGSRSTYAELLKASGLSDDIQAKFAPVYLSHGGGGAQLWDEARKAGLNEAQIGKLQLQGKLAFLARNSEPMTRRLMQKQIDDPARLVEQNFDRADQWKAEARALADSDEQKLASLIPAAYPGERVEDRLDDYAEDMAR
jgi:hypothetical protein